MKFSKAANEALVQAQQLRLTAEGGSPLCIEHLFYGLLRLACYLDSPMDKAEFRKEAEAVRKELEPQMISIASAIHQLKVDARNPKENFFVDASAVVGRASEISQNAGLEEVDAMCFLKAVLENQTSLIQALMGLRIDACLVDDAKYAPKKVEKPVKPKPVAAPAKPAAEPAKPVAAPVVKPAAAPAKPAAEPAKQDAELDQRLLAALLLDLARDHQKKIRQEEEALKKYRRQVGLKFLWRTLLGFGIPAVILGVLNHFTGIVLNPPTPVVALILYIFVVLWGFYLIKGVNMLFGLISKPFELFLGLVLGCATLFGLMLAVRKAYDLPMWSLTSWPMWMRWVTSIGGLLILSFGMGTFEFVENPKNDRKPTLTLFGLSGTVDKLFFQFLTGILCIPLATAAHFWLFKVEYPGWYYKTLWVYGYLMVWGVFALLWSLLRQHYDKSGRHKGRQIFAFMMDVLNTLLFLPGLVLYLHWIFDWFPMKIWVIVLYAIYMIFVLIVSVGVYNYKKENV